MHPIHLKSFLLLLHHRLNQVSFPDDSPRQSRSELSQVWTGDPHPMGRVPANSWISAQAPPLVSPVLIVHFQTIVLWLISWGHFWPQNIVSEFPTDDLDLDSNFILCILQLPSHFHPSRFVSSPLLSHPVKDSLQQRGWFVNFSRCHMRAWSSQRERERDGF